MHIIIIIVVYVRSYTYVHTYIHTPYVVELCVCIVCCVGSKNKIAKAFLFVIKVQRATLYVP